MRTFSEIKQDLGLKRLASNPIGTLYYVPFKPQAARIMVRHFHSNEEDCLAAEFASLTAAAQGWIDAHPPLDRLVRVIQPLEVGQDFVARDHLTYATSTRSYEHDEDEITPEPPEQLATMREAFRRLSSQPCTEHERIVTNVLSRSLLEPSGKTVFFENDGKFAIVEIKATLEELRAWRRLRES